MRRVGQAECGQRWCRWCDRHPAPNLKPPPSPLPAFLPPRSSVVREFRSVATLTAAQLVTSWIHVSQALGEARNAAERQLAAEERKKGGGQVPAGCLLMRRSPPSP